MTLTACGVGSLQSSTPGGAGGTPQEPFEGPVAKAECTGANDQPETGLQGQIPAADRASGRSLEPYTCNLELVGTANEDGAGWQHAWYEDCAYYTTTQSYGIGNTAPKVRTGQRGVIIVDAANTASPQIVGNLDTASMLDPWESLKTNERRELLGAVNGTAGGGGPQIDLYDISGDCKAPQLIVSTAVGTANGHAGHFAPDGQTYYGGSFNSAANFKAIDISDPANPALLLQGFPIGTHDLTLSQDGTRAYFASPGTSQGNGLGILDVSQIQARAPDPAPTVISEVGWTDGATAQMAQLVTIKGRPYVLFVDEGGKGASRLIDISDETNPVIASKLKLEVHMPANANATNEDADGTIFGYEGHYCTASDGVNDHTTYDVNDAAIIACGYFQSGLRVFDVRDPYRPREIAYYNPGANPGYHGGSNYNLTGDCNTTDWSASHPRVRPSTNEIWFTSQCNGFHVVRFTRPLSELLGPAP